MLTLKEKMKKGPVFGMACFTSAACVVETIGNYGLDFVFLDLEHTPLDAGSRMEYLIMAAKLSGVSPLVRVTGVNEVEIRKCLEMGAEGVIIPHIRTKEEAEECVKAAKFPPLGRRGTDTNVRAAGFGGPGFKWENYIAQSNKDTMIIPMEEDFEFNDNLKEILAVPGVDAVNFGPLDYSLSINVPIRYQMEEPLVVEAFSNLTKEARPKGIGVMAPAVPPTLEGAKDLIAKGANMIILGNDMFHFQTACKKVIAETVAPIRQLYKMN